MNSIYHSFDRVWCGETQLPASNLLKITGDLSKVRKLSIYRILIAICMFIQILGNFFITVGLFSWNPISFLVSGILLKVVGGLYSSHIQNRAGVLWSLEIQDSLKNLKTHSQEIASLLAHKGCSESEIQGIQNLPSEVYSPELNSYNQALVLNIGAPLACGLALIANGEVIIGLIVIVLGLISFPLGEYFFNEYTFKHDSEMRVGKSASYLPFIKNIYEEHLALTFKVNALSQIPLVLFAVRFFWKNSGQLLAIFYGLTQGLSGLTGTLAFQRSRMTALRSTHTAKHLIDVISGPLFIITNKRWEEHRQRISQLPTPTLLENLKEGVAFVDFSPQFSNDFLPLTLSIPSRSACILQAPSGKGKSSLGAAILHLIEHEGSMYFIDNCTWVNVHDLDRVSFERSIIYFKEENIEKSARIVDLFKNIFEKYFFEDRVRMQLKHGKMLTDLALKASDNLLEHEVSNLEEGNKSVFPLSMLSDLKLLRILRIEWVRKICSDAGGNLNNLQVHPQRIFSSLSSGERRRVITTLSYETAKVFPAKLLILDEPLSHLDDVSIHHQIESISKIQVLNISPALLIISHNDVDLLCRQLQNSTLVKF